jgi:hypothetical protein
VTTQPQLFDDAGVAHHHVDARSAVDPYARPALDGGHRAAGHGVPLDDLDIQPRPGQIAGGDQTVVPGADDDDIASPGAHRSTPMTA